MRRGTRARFTLTDGSTCEATVRFSWSWFSWKLADAVFHDQRTGEPIPADGYLMVPKRSVLFVQVVA